MRIPRLDENNRYTVAGGTSESGADGLDRRGPVAAFEEQGPGGVDDRGPSQAGPGLAAFAVDGFSALVLAGSPRLETSTLELRVILIKS